MSVETYLWMHLAGVGLTLLALGAIAQERERGRTLTSIAHGCGILLVLVGGFGLLVRHGIHWPWPGWVMVKILVWLLLGSSAVFFKRLPRWRHALGGAVWCLFLLAAYLGIHTPP